MHSIYIYEYSYRERARILYASDIYSILNLYKGVYGPMEYINRVRLECKYSANIVYI